MYTIQQTLKTSDLRKHTAEVISEVSESDQPITVFSHSTPKLVMMNIALFNKMKNTKSSIGEEKAQSGRSHEVSGIDAFIDPPQDMLIKKRGIDAVKEIRKLR